MTDRKIAALPVPSFHKFLVRVKIRGWNDTEQFIDAEVSREELGDAVKGDWLRFNHQGVSLEAELVRITPVREGC